MASHLGLALLLLLLLLLLLPLPLPGSARSAGGNRCVAAAEACTADARCQGLRTEYVARCLGRAASGGCPRARCHRALRRFFARGPPALTLALLFCRCADPACAERRRQTFVPSCAFAEPGRARPSCLEPLDACEHSGVCRPRLRAFQASCAPAPVAPEGCPTPQIPRCWLAYAGLVGTIITPNYVDNVSARVAPWCDCAGSGNRREECEGFRGLLTRNLCLGKGPRQSGLESTHPSGWRLPSTPTQVAWPRGSPLGGSQRLLSPSAIALSCPWGSAHPAASGDQILDFT
ncbi:GDNF family receptor alpha-4 [Tenrec ecaudatus]|uniref:GDNF family receptor alpha-4 n=1 Tax=Tenrec ecaudatus TaxID=94439 RepID=UPI003F5A2CE5